MELKRLLRLLGRRFPLSSSEKWDHPGYQLGPRDYNRDISSVFLALDLTEAALMTIRERKPDLVLTHHPFFFGRPSAIRRQDSMKAKLADDLEKENVIVYSYHTCFDKGEGGMNDSIVTLLGLHRSGIGKDGYLRLFPSPVEDFSSLCSLVGEKLSLPFVLAKKNGVEKVRKIGLVAGGAGNDFSWALQEEVDVYISGDASHHARLDMERYGLGYIELPHECEELGFFVGMKRCLLEIEPTLSIEVFPFEKYLEIYRNA